MIDYDGLKTIFGSKLPEAHIFFATVAAHKYVPSYQALRKGLGLSPSHTNRKVWKIFTKAYANSGPVVPALSFSKNLVLTQTATVGDNVTFSITATGGKTPYTYKWYYGAVLIDSAINPTAATATLVNSAVEVASSGAYKAEVTDSAGAKITSNVCTLTVNTA